MIGKLRIGLIVLAAAMTALFGYLTLRQESLRDAIAPQVEIGGPFRLASANGGFVDSKDLAGKPYGVFFGFTHCPEVCPTTLYEMSGTLGDMGAAAGDFRLFFITVDPDRDTAAKMKDYVTNFDPRIEALIPSTAELPRLAAQFRALYEKVPTSDGAYTMNHTATVYLMGRDGRLQSTLAFGEAPEQRRRKLERLVAGGT